MKGQTEEFYTPFHPTPSMLDSRCKKQNVMRGIEQDKTVSRRYLSILKVKMTYTC